MAIDLSNIMTGTRIKPPRVVLYGVGGIGKTTFAAGAPKPVFMFTEDGQGNLDVARFQQGEDPVFRNWQDIIDGCERLYYDEHDYQTLVIDGLDFAEPLLWAHTSKKHNKPDIEAFGYGKGYAYAVDEARTLFGWLDSLRNHRGMSIVCICHSHTKKYESPDSESYDRYQLSLNEKFGQYVKNWCDVLLFANYKMHIVKDKESFSKERKRGVGQGERVMYSEERPSHWAKNHFGLPYELPLSWAAFQEGIVVPVADESPPKAEKKETKKEAARAAK